MGAFIWSNTVGHRYLKRSVGLQQAQCTYCLAYISSVLVVLSPLYIQVGTQVVSGVLNGKKTYHSSLGRSMYSVEVMR